MLTDQHCVKKTNNKRSQIQDNSQEQKIQFIQIDLIECILIEFYLIIEFYFSYIFRMVRIVLNFSRTKIEYVSTDFYFLLLHPANNSDCSEFGLFLLLV